MDAAKVASLKAVANEDLSMVVPLIRTPRCQNNQQS